MVDKDNLDVKKEDEYNAYITYFAKFKKSAAIYETTSLYVGDILTLDNIKEIKDKCVYHLAQQRPIDELEGITILSVIPLKHERRIKTDDLGGKSDK
jgi:hypothetical protein